MVRLCLRKKLRCVLVSSQTKFFFGFHETSNVLFGPNTSFESKGHYINKRMLMVGWPSLSSPKYSHLVKSSFMFFATLCHRSLSTMNRLALCTFEPSCWCKSWAWFWLIYFYGLKFLTDFGPKLYDGISYTKLTYFITSYKEKLNIN